MFLILSQKIDLESKYNDIPFKIYHYPKRYRNQIKTGDIFIYYQGDRYRRENRYYFGCGIVGEITCADDGEHYYAKIINGINFPNKVPIYNPVGGFFESIDYQEVRQKENPAWQNSIRKVAEGSFKTIINSSGLDYDLIIDLLEIEANTFIKENDNEAFGKLTKGVGELELENLIETVTEEEIDNIISKLDGSGSIELKQLFQKIRKASRKTTMSLKKLYNYTCQICEANHNGQYGVNVVEAHHIEDFSKTQNHQPHNIVILCPTHHRLIHAGSAEFDRPRKIFIYENGYEESLKINKHL